MSINVERHVFNFVGKKKNKVMVVYFVGGVTYMEIAALRLLSSLEGHDYNIVVATTKLINGNTLLSSLIEQIENKLQPL